MPPVEITELDQVAIVWSSIGTDRYGEVTLGTPIEIPVRWVNKQSDMVDDDGNNVGLEAFAVTKQDIRINSLMWLGTLEEWYGTGSDGSFGEGSNLCVVKAFNRVPDIKNRSTYRVCGLARYKEKVPS